MFSIYKALEKQGDATCSLPLREFQYHNRIIIEEIHARKVAGAPSPAWHGAGKVSSNWLGRMKGRASLAGRPVCTKPQRLVTTCLSCCKGEAGFRHTA